MKEEVGAARVTAGMVKKWNGVESSKVEESERLRDRGEEKVGREGVDAQPPLNELPFIPMGRPPPQLRLAHNLGYGASPHGAPPAALPARFERLRSHVLRQAFRSKPFVANANSATARVEWTIAACLASAPNGRVSQFRNIGTAG